MQCVCLLAWQDAWVEAAAGAQLHTPGETRAQSGPQTQVASAESHSMYLLRCRASQWRKHPGLLDKRRRSQQDRCTRADYDPQRLV